MTSQAPPPPPGPVGWFAIFRRFWQVAGRFWTEAPSRRLALGLLLLLLVLNGAEVALFLRFNTWNRDLFDALEQRDSAQVLAECGVLAMIVAGFCLIASAGLLVRRRLALGWRAWLAHRVTIAWLAAGGTGPANPDGRIAEDARIATEEAVELFSSLVNALITLACFVEVLWRLSAHAPMPLGTTVFFALPGYLVWLALVYALVGMAATMIAGRPLVRSTDLRQAMEADYRAGLVQTRDARRGPGPADGPVLGRLFGGVASAFNRQSYAFARLELFVCGFTRFGLGLPFLVATPAFLAGVVSLGWVMQAAQAFQTVASALSWPIGNMPRIATWRASAERVIALHDMASAATSPARREVDALGSAETAAKLPA